MIYMSGCTDGESTAERGFAPGLDPVPELFQIEQVTAGDSQLIISWDQSKHAKKYKIYYKLSTDSTFSEIDAVSSPYTLGGLTNGQTYDLKILAYNERGEIFSLSTQGVPAEPYSLPKVSMLEQVQSSIQVKLTARNYKISGHLQVGMGSKLKSTTSPRGYQLSLTSQGNILTGGQNE